MEIATFTTGCPCVTGFCQNDKFFVHIHKPLYIYINDSYIDEISISTKGKIYITFKNKIYVKYDELNEEFDKLDVPIDVHYIKKILSEIIDLVTTQIEISSSEAVEFVEYAWFDRYKN